MCYYLNVHFRGQRVNANFRSSEMRRGVAEREVHAGALGLEHEDHVRSKRREHFVPRSSVASRMPGVLSDL